MGFDSTRKVTLDLGLFAKPSASPRGTNANNSPKKQAIPENIINRDFTFTRPLINLALPEVILVRFFRRGNRVAALRSEPFDFKQAGYAAVSMDTLDCLAKKGSYAETTNGKVFRIKVDSVCGEQCIQITFA